MAKEKEQTGIATPKVGDIVWWYPKADEKNTPAPAIVTKIENTGRLALTVFKANAFPLMKTNVYWAKYPNIERQSAVINRCGCWDYKEGRIPSGAYDHQKADELRREEARKAAAEAAARQAEAEKAAAKAKANEKETVGV